MVEMSLRETTVKVIIVGDPGVGKTSILRKFLGVPNSSQSSFKEMYKKQIALDGDRVINLEFWDLPDNQSQVHTVPPQYFRDAKGAVVVFDVSKDGTFKNC